MATRRRAVLSTGVTQLRERIEHWRRTRERRTVMPAELWSEAVTLAGREGPYGIARALRINFEALKRRIAEAGSGATGTPVAATRSAFVELTGAQILEASSREGASIELTDKAGTHLTVRLPVDAKVDVARLVLAFRRRGGA